MQIFPFFLLKGIWLMSKKKLNLTHQLINNSFVSLQLTLFFISFFFFVGLFEVYQFQIYVKTVGRPPRSPPLQSDWSIFSSIEASHWHRAKFSGTNHSESPLIFSLYDFVWLINKLAAKPSQLEYGEKKGQRQEWNIFLSNISISLCRTLQAKYLTTECLISTNI